MPRNIVIFADGTGQRGGIFFDENRSNIYKLYRATRCGPEYSVNPAEQLAFYDPGSGTEPIEGNFFFRLYRRLHNLVSQATGLGLTLNVIQCYAAIIRMWRPDDRIFLFGFSRGAYTVRALGGVLSYFGVPTHMADGSPLLRDEASTLRIAKEAVKDVYQFTSSGRRDDAADEQKMRMDQRNLLAARFRRKYGSGDGEASNTVPHFIGSSTPSLRWPTHKQSPYSSRCWPPSSLLLPGYCRSLPARFFGGQESWAALPLSSPRYGTQANI
ncbi:T6SS phospholipase effector Tle1-like catalytic domain-containing protein [Allomesorhizobium camelthorni]|uniref:phospholipase effector Tle1 domain-containing protein n=1 Tax=Allomesorhizobium camelthorni TaxID=475069 RepID=UPI001FE64CD2|nr:DUF2235 domain-containing protein [Mesorhizobium camelthorni]